MAMKEEKAAKSSAKAGRSGLFIVLSGRIPTGSTFQLLAPTGLPKLATFFHFVPHLSCKSFIVKKKLEGASPTSTLTRETAKHCG